MNTNLFSLFLEVVHAGSFAEAARRLDMDPSAVSRGIAQLEADLSARLFQRSTRHLSLTEAGQRFASRIEGVAEELASIREDLGMLAKQPRGRLCISASVAFGQKMILPLVARFRRDYPEIRLDLKFVDRNVSLIDDHVDIAIRLAPRPEGDLMVKKLMSTRYRLCASAAYLRSRGMPTRPQDLADYDLLTFDLPDFQKLWQFRRDDKITPVNIEPQITISSAMALRTATRDGLGVALLADWLVGEDIDCGDLVPLLPDYEVTATSFDTAAWMLYPSRAFLPQATRLGLAFLSQHLGN